MPALVAIELTEYFDFSSPDAIRIKGHRIGIEHVLERYLAGYNPDEIAKDFPGLSLEKIYATITYYLANRDGTDAYLHKRRERDNQAYLKWARKPSPLIERLRAIREEGGTYS